MYYGYLADFVVLVHVAIVGYVVLGQLAIIVASAFRWEWGRNRWFRLSHLLVIGIVAYEALYNIRCPLTVWEEQLRAMGGQVMVTGQSFMGRLAHDILFGLDLPELFFNTIHVAMFVVVLQGLIMYPPRLWRRKSTVPAMAAPVLEPVPMPEPLIV